MQFSYPVVDAFHDNCISSHFLHYERKVPSVWVKICSGDLSRDLLEGSRSTTTPANLQYSVPLMCLSSLQSGCLRLLKSPSFGMLIISQASFGFYLMLRSFCCLWHRGMTRRLLPLPLPLPLRLLYSTPVGASRCVTSTGSSHLANPSRLSKLFEFATFPFSVALRQERAPPPLVSRYYNTRLVRAGVGWCL